MHIIYSAACLFNSEQKVKERERNGEKRLKTDEKGEIYRHVV